jgi:epoxyqueuosine reductase
VKETLRQKALELGFDAVGFTTASPPDHASDFTQWIQDGSHGEMGYLARNAGKRIDPERVLQGAKSIICLATSYFKKEDPRPLARTTESGIVARYARYSDYHEVLGTRLEEFTQWLNTTSPEGTRSLWYVDTGPFLERDLAQRSGLGFVGKHNNLIHHKLGNWIFLSVIITSLDIIPDAPDQNHCGKCTRCMTACPTAAIRKPFYLDARRCISYLTIELKGSIPLEWRRAIGNRIYGCDDCLAACPWNRWAREGNLMKQFVRDDLVSADLIELLQLDEAGFRQRFRGTPLFRTKRRGVLRNVCVALGNIGDQTALPHLARMLTDAEPLIREHAAWAIEEIQHRARSGV